MFSALKNFENTFSRLSVPVQIKKIASTYLVHLVEYVIKCKILLIYALTNKHNSSFLQHLSKIHILNTKTPLSVKQTRKVLKGYPVHSIIVSR